MTPFVYLDNPTTDEPRWCKWIGRLQHYFRAMRETDGTTMRSMMLHMGEDELYDLFEHPPNTGADDDFDAAVAGLNRHFDPQMNPDYERFKLHQAWQADVESVDTFFSWLTKLASMCTEINNRMKLERN
ncbi:hypothetical protein NDU88_001483 [Pleurodeles waltl]|uniref:Uncharacterized protein n=1 Tax=Pleurodeles waltl TaxID=8319 RepID=A0AAV7WKN2_PLEWA|nr:hypothetical protein NDU88_001483 [Pleurodeles waltl]